MTAKPSLSTQLKQIVGDQKPQYCNQCGKCTSVCPVARFLDFRPRRIIGMVQLDMIEELLKSDEIWNCAECLSCKERCPREVSPYDAVQALRNICVERGLPFPDGHLQLIKSIFELGLIQPPQRVRSRTKERFDRRSLGLPTIKKPLDLEKFTEALSNIIKLEGTRD